jgi:hypothetical protein
VSGEPLGEGLVAPGEVAGLVRGLGVPQRHGVPAETQRGLVVGGVCAVLSAEVADGALDAEDQGNELLPAAATDPPVAGI